MSDEKEKNRKTEKTGEKIEEKKPPEPEEAPPAAVPGSFTDQPAQSTAQNKEKRRRRKVWLRRLLTLLILAGICAGGFFAWKRFHPADDAGEAQVMTDFVRRGSITSIVEGSGVATAKNSASVTLLAGGQVLDVYVKEGDFVTEGTPLYTVQSQETQDRVNDAVKAVNNYQKELNKLYADSNDLNVRAEYDGFLQEAEKLQEGDPVAKGVTVAKLVDDTRMLLMLYYSTAYENDVSEGQEALISIPASMAQVPGQVKEVRRVRRISPEGSQLFAVVFVMDNPGALTEGMTATATIESGGETVYPYEPGKLEFFRSTEIRPKVSGDVSWSGLYDYARVKAGDSVLTLTGDDTEAELATLENQLRSAQKQLEDAQKTLDSLNATAPIDGTVLSLAVTAGEEAKAGVVAASIADTTTMVINTKVDEMNVSLIQAGMTVDIDQWGTPAVGVVESVSLSGQYENGVSRFPVVINVDNSEGLLMSGSYVNYKFVASQSEDCLVVGIQCVKSVQTAEGETQRVVFVRAEEPPEGTVELAAPMTDIPEGFWPVAVEIGISDNYNVELLSGVEEDTEVYMSKASSSESEMGMMF